MRNVKLDMKVRIPSWNFCNLDDFTANGRLSKEVCRFCAKTKNGYRCTLYDESLAADDHFVHKACRCIKVSAGFPDEPPAPTPPPSVTPKAVAQDAIQEYKKTVAYLLSQGYTRSLAETAAEQSVLGGS